MRWHAILAPDGEALSVCPIHRGAWSMALGLVDTTSQLYREWYKHDSHDDCVAAVNALGYRCVEVNLVEPEQAGALEQAFIQGAAWWEWHKEGATMWQSDRALALEEAERRTENGSLGKSPEVNPTTAEEGAKP